MKSRSRRWFLLNAFYHLCRHSKKPAGPHRSPSEPGHLHDRERNARNGITGTRTPRGRRTERVVGIVTPQIAVSRSLVRCTRSSRRLWKYRITAAWCTWYTCRNTRRVHQSSAPSSVTPYKCVSPCAVQQVNGEATRIPSMCGGSKNSTWPAR